MGHRSPRRVVDTTPPCCPPFIRRHLRLRRVNGGIRLVYRKEPVMHSAAALQLVHESPHRDLGAAEVAAAAFLRALGISLDSESLAGTPARIARGYAELFTPPTFDLTTFPNDEGYDELVISRNLPLRS